MSPGEVPVLAARRRVLGPPPGEPRFFPISGRPAVLRLLIRTRPHGKDFNNARKEIAGPKKETNNSSPLEFCSCAQRS